MKFLKTVVWNPRVRGGTKGGLTRFLPDEGLAKAERGALDRYMVRRGAVLRSITHDDVFDLGDQVLLVGPHGEEVSLSDEGRQ